MRHLRAAVVFILAQAAYGQALVVDQPYRSNAAKLGVPRGFVGDHFVLGSHGEVWVIDSLSTWVSRADLPGTVKLLGGVEADLSPQGTPAQPDCACHNLTVLKSGAVGPEIRVSAVAPRIWRIDFQDLRWSVPGGVPIQFGVLGAGRNTASRTTSHHDLRLFDDDGKLLGRYMAQDAPPDQALGIDVQVRGHRTVPVALRASGGMLEVALQPGNGFDPAQADPASLRLGFRHVPPVSTTEAPNRLLLQFRREDVGPRPGELTVCLTGTLRDGIPFEGCDLVPKP